MKAPEALRCVKQLLGLYRRNEMTPGNIQSYGEMIIDLDFDETTAAIRRLASTLKFFPSISEIRAEVAARSCAHLPLPEVAWGEVSRAIGAVGRNRKPEWSCPEIADAVEGTGGWQLICNDENTMSTRARFVDAYRALRNGTVKIENLGPYAMPAPTPIGVPRLPPSEPIVDSAPERTRAMLSPQYQSILDKYSNNDP